MNPVRLITPATLAPVSLSEAKDHLKVVEDDENSLIQSYLNAAVERCQNYRQSQIMSAEYELYARTFVPFINLQKHPVSAINSVKYYDTDGDLQTVSAVDYRLQNFRVPCRLEFDSGFDYPDLHDREHPVVVNFQAGYLGASAVPAVIKHAVFLELGTMHTIRQSEVLGIGLTSILMKEASMNILDAETLWL